MSYLLIDWEKGFFEANLSAPEAEKIWVFVKKKSAIRQVREWLACLKKAKLVCVPKNKKIARQMAKKWQKILEKDENAQIWIVSKRKKVAHYLNDSLNEYPDAAIVLWEQSWAENPDNPEHHLHDDENHEINKINKNQIIESKTKPSDTHSKTPKPKHKPVGIIQDITHQEQKNFQMALVLLKKMRPNKKEELIQLIKNNLRVNTAQAIHIIQHLESHGMLSVDITQNVRYFHD